MSNQTIAVIGGGQMGRALIGGMLASRVVTDNAVWLVEPSEAGRQWWAEHHSEVKLAELTPAVGAAEIVLIAVKPEVVAGIAKQSGRLWRGKLIVSIAAGIGLQQLSSWFGHDRVVRVMPNTPSLVRAGASGYCCGPAVTAADRQTIETMLGAVGTVVEVAEHQMDAVTGLSGSGPAYVCLIIEALADGGVLAGLPRPLAMQLATQTLLGTARMIAETGRHPGELKDAVASPGGTTIAALAVLEQNGVRGTLAQAVAAAARRSRELGHPS